ncbi:tetratricopeptide repeat protein [Catalinimonas niigatensis]|uniref:tetratricopeptide repeat protein n=1 Tax=Catalinimonas niigatensis TaxID=1397264 RepID=UPI0026653A37|nr:tetratricopeptide repeat protein [Catalinimonas niigatensis]WPP50408.1 tetratricopeptide repeat protein [Catalinimonas niigatensis]
MIEKKTIFYLTIFYQLLIIFVTVFSAFASTDSGRKPIRQQHLKESQQIQEWLKLSARKWDEDPHQAEILARKALTLAKQIKDEDAKGKALLRLGSVKWALGQYEQALDCYLKALTLHEQTQDSLLLATITTGLGLVYDELQNYERSLHYHRRSLQLEKSLNNLKEEARCYNNMGAVFFDLKQYDSAAWYLEQALEIRILEKDTFGMAESYNNVGYVHFVSGETDFAMTNYHKALSIWSEIGSANGMAYTLKNIGQAYLKKKDYTLAEKYLLQSLETGKSIDNRKWEAATLEVLKEMEVSRKNYAQALTYDAQYDALRDSLLNTEKTRQIAEMEARFESGKKEKELILQEQKIEVLRQDRQIKTLWRNSLVLLLALLSAIAFFVIRYQQLKRRKDRQLYDTRQALVKTALENAHLKALELKDELHLKNKELTSYTLNFLQKNELMEEVKEQINDLRKNSEGKLSGQLKKVHWLLDQHQHVDKVWEEFKLYFEQVNEGFFKNIKEAFPDLTPNELKICALMYLNLNIKEMANILGIAPDSVKVARHRIRKKLNLKREESLVDFVRMFDPLAQREN